MATISSQYVRSVLSNIQTHQLDSAPLLKYAGISQGTLLLSECRVHEIQFLRLIQAVRNTLNDEFMGYTSVPCTRGTFAMMCQLMRRCDNLDEMFKLGIRFYELITNDIQMEYRHVDGGREFVVSVSDKGCDGDTFFLELLLVVCHRLFSWLIGHKINLEAIYFSYPEPSHSEEIKTLFSCPCFFDAPETKLGFDKKYSKLRPARSSCELEQLLELSLDNRDFHCGGVGEYVSSSLLAHFRETKLIISFDDLASSLNLSRQTLRRRLKEEGTSYKEIKDRVLCDIAIENVGANKMSLIDISYMLGYSEPSTFNRAFKRWVGISPGSFRRSTSINSA